MIGEILELVSAVFMIFEPPYKKRTAKENLEWAKQQNWFLTYTSDPKWENMLHHDKKMRRILGSFSNNKLLSDREIQETLRDELVGHYKMWKIGWKLR